jgi:transcriptional regulator with XRE-family HTH domain
MKVSTDYQQLMLALKKVLKGKGKTYADAANVLGLSESSVKRIFSAKDGPVGKIEGLCDWLGVSFKDLSDLAFEDSQEDYVLTSEQEEVFLKYPHLFLFFAEIVEFGKSVEEVQAEHGLSDISMTRYLSILDRIKLIELLPGNKIKINIPGFITVSEQSFLAKKLIRETLHLLADDLVGKRDLIWGKQVFNMGELLFTEESAAYFQGELKELFKRMGNRSAKEIRLYGRRGLTPMMHIMGLLPLKMLRGRIPNWESTKVDL